MTPGPEHFREPFQTESEPSAPLPDRDTEIDPLAMCAFGVRDHLRHHPGCLERRGIAGHHYDEHDECALVNIIRRYGDARAERAEAELAEARATLARVEAWIERLPFRSDIIGHQSEKIASELRAALAAGSPTVSAEGGRVLAGPDEGYTPGGMPCCDTCGRWGCDGCRHDTPAPVAPVAADDDAQGGA